MRRNTLKRKLKNPKVALILIGILALLAALGLAREQLGEAGRLLGDVRWAYLLLLPPLQAVNYLGVAKHHQAFLGYFGLRPPLFKLFGLGLAVNFVNSAAPSLGVSGASFFTYSLNQNGVPGGKSSLAYVSRYILMYLAFVAVLAVGVIALLFAGEANRWVVRVAALLGLGIVLLSAWILYELAHKERFDRLVRWVLAAVDKLGMWLRKDNRPILGRQRVERALGEFHEGFRAIRRHRRRALVPFGWMLLSSVAEVATLYAVLVAFGHWLNPGIVIYGYALGNLAGFFAAVVPAGVGAYEAGMVAAFAATGLPLALALSATLLYRVLNMAMSFSFGFYFYQRYVREAQDG